MRSSRWSVEKRARTSSAAAAASRRAQGRVVGELAERAASAGAEPGATRRPVSPSRTISGSPPVFEATTHLAAAARLERHEAERLRAGGGYAHDVGRAVQRVEVVAEPQQAQAVAEPEVGAQRLQRALVALLAGPRVAGHQADRTALAQRGLGERARQHLLALPRSSGGRARGR